MQQEVFLVEIPAHRVIVIARARRGDSQGLRFAAGE